MAGHLDISDLVVKRLMGASVADIATAARQIPVVSRGRVPVPVFELIKYFGWNVVETAEVAIAGTDGSKRAILVNPSLPLADQRFAAAHHLAHIGIHRSLAPGYPRLRFSPLPPPRRAPGWEGKHMYGVDAPDAYEREANEFAAFLLIPLPQLEGALNGGASLDDIAAWFQVPVPALRWHRERLR